jgi:hypothetical protein
MLIAENQNSKQKMAVQKYRQAVLTGDVQNVHHYNSNTIYNVVQRNYSVVTLFSDSLSMKTKGKETNSMIHDFPSSANSSSTGQESSWF